MFVERLARTRPTKHSVNFYSHGEKENGIRRRNLAAYLTARLENNSRVLLVGEAPGYRGTRRTGVPFSSERIVLTHPFFTSRKAFSIENTEHPLAESSASIVWNTMDVLRFYPLIWAAFPFHPHQPGNEESNRAPTAEELLGGQTFLMSLMEMFDIVTVVAVGRAAEKTLGALNIPAITIRHPSHGGANRFRNGLTKFMKLHGRMPRERGVSGAGLGGGYTQDMVPDRMADAPSVATGVRLEPVVRFFRDQSLRDFQECIRKIYALSDDRLFSLTDLLFNQERFTMRALKGIRKGDTGKLRKNLLIAFSWTLAVCNRLHIDAEEILWRRFPALCSYCGEAPCACRAHKPAERVRVTRKASLRPERLSDFQKMFRSIYPPDLRTLADAGIHLAEETGEVGEVVHWYLGEHQHAQFEQLQDEIADWISCMFGVANSSATDAAAELEALYHVNCHDCHQVPCGCTWTTVRKFHS